MKQLTTFEALLYSSTRYQRAGWLIPLFLRFATLGRNEVAEHTGLSAPTAQKYLDDLAHLGIIVRQGYREGYALTVGGKQLVAQDLLEAGEPVAEVVEAVAKDSGSLESKVKSLPSTLSRKIEEDRVLIKLKDSLLSSDSRVESKKFTFSFEQILERTNLLFEGKTVYTTNLTPLDAETTLGWLAQTYDQRGRVKDPVRVAYSNIQKNEKGPDRKYLDNPEAYLPDAFLDALGLYQQACPRCDEPFTSLAAYNTHFEACLMTHLPEAEPATLSADETVTDQVREAWQGVMEHLQGSLPRVQFEMWLDGAEPVRCADGQLLISARDMVACDWLSGHVAEQAQRLLINTMGAVSVQFVSTETEVQS